MLGKIPELRSDERFGARDQVVEHQYSTPIFDLEPAGANDGVGIIRWLPCRDDRVSLTIQLHLAGRRLHRKPERKLKSSVTRARKNGTTNGIRTFGANI